MDRAILTRLRAGFRRFRRPPAQLEERLHEMCGQVERLATQCETLASRLDRLEPQMEASQAGSRSDVDACRADIEKVCAEIRRLSRTTDPARFERMEALIAEHPRVHSRTAAVESFASPAVSVVMPTWNRAGIIGAAIRSVQAQLFTDWELLIVDDGSVDDTEAVVRSFAEPRITFARQSHQGQSAARNHALRLARGELVAYLDSDNLWYPEYLATAVALFADRPETDCAYGFIVNGKERPELFSMPFDQARLSQANFIPMTAFIHRRSLVERFGGFYETLGRFEDWDLVLRYTAHRPPYRLPVRAARRRAMDAIRVTDTRPRDADFARVKASAGGQA